VQKKDKLKFVFFFVESTGLTLSFLQSYALKIDQTKKRSSELGVFLN
jgi:hypothetical protein